MLSRLPVAVVVRVDGEDETQLKEHELNLNLNLNSLVPQIPVSVFAASFVQTKLASFCAPTRGAKEREAGTLAAPIAEAAKSLAG